MTINLSDYIAGFAVLISIISLYKSYSDYRINLHATIDRIDKASYLNIYNNSIRVVTITYFEIYSANSRFKRFSKRDYVTTGYTEGSTNIYTIEPHQRTTITFKDFYTIDNKYFNKKLYIKLRVSGKPYKTIRVDL